MDGRDKHGHDGNSLWRQFSITVNFPRQLDQPEAGMKTAYRIVIAAGMTLLLVSAAQAQDKQQDKLKIGLIATLSGPPAVLGQQLRNGFTLAVKNLGGKLGGREADVIVADDELKPDVAITKVKALVERDKVEFIVGPIFSNILQAIMKPATEGGAILISPNAGTSNFAGKDCNPNFFVTSYQNDQVFAVSGKHAQDSGIKKVYLIAPNYQAGRDALAGFKSAFKGEIADEVYVPLNQLDYAAELSRIAAATPDAVYVFLPGGMGVNFVKQFRQAGLADKITFLSAFTVDEDPAGAAGCRAWLLRRRQLGARPGHSAKQGVRGRLREGIRRRARDLRVPGLRRRAPHRQRGSTGRGQSRQQGSAARRADEGRFQVAARQFQVQHQSLPIQDFYLVKVAKRAMANSRPDRQEGVR